MIESQAQGSQSLDAVFTSRRKIRADLAEILRAYDGLGRPTSVNAGGVSTLYSYGYESIPGSARVDKVSTPFASGETAYNTVTTYDALGRPLTVSGPDGTVTTSNYNGLTTSVTDANNHTHTTVSDILGRTL